MLFYKKDFQFYKMKRARQINIDTQGNVYCEFHVTIKNQLQTHEIQRAN